MFDQAFWKKVKNKETFQKVHSKFDSLLFAMGSVLLRELAWGLKVGVTKAAFIQIQNIEVRQSGVLWLKIVNSQGKHTLI